MPPLHFQPHGNLSHAEALQLAKLAPKILRKNPTAFSILPLQSLFSAPETADLWTTYENLLLSCLRTSNDEAAHQCLERLVMRFGEKDERIGALQGLVKEAEATSDNDLQNVLSKYEAILTENDTNSPIAKRRVALLRSMGRIPESIEALTSFLDFNPTDPEAWVELGDLYLSQGLYAQAIYSLEEALVLSPNGWNLHARLGEVSLMAAQFSSEGILQKYLVESMKRFCRSIELCENYLRGYYGLKLVTDKLIDGLDKAKKQPEAVGFLLPEQSTIKKLNLAATKKLSEIVRRFDAQERIWQGYNAGEVDAARDLIAKSSFGVVQ